MRFAVIILAILATSLPANAANDTANIAELAKKINDAQITWTPGEDLIQLNSQFTGFTSLPPPGATIKEASKLIIWAKLNGVSPVVELNGTKYCSESCAPLVQYGNNLGLSGVPTYRLVDRTIYVDYHLNYIWNFIFQCGKFTCNRVHTDDLTISFAVDAPSVHPSSLIDYSKQNITVLRNIPGGQRILTNNSAYQFNYDIHSSNGTAEIRKYYYTIIKGENYYAIANRTEPEDISETEFAMGITRTGDLVMPITNIFSATSYDLFGKGHGIAKINLYKEEDDKSLLNWNVIIVTGILCVMIFELMKKPKIIS